MCTFVLTAYICYLSHDTPPLSEVSNRCLEHLSFGLGVEIRGFTALFGLLQLRLVFRV